MASSTPIATRMPRTPSAIFGSASATFSGSSTMSVRRACRSFGTATRRVSHASAASGSPDASAARIYRSYRAVVRPSHSRLVTTAAPTPM